MRPTDPALCFLGDFWWVFQFPSAWCLLEGVTISLYNAHHLLAIFKAESLLLSDVTTVVHTSV